MRISLPYEGWKKGFFNIIMGYQLRLLKNPVVPVLLWALCLFVFPVTGFADDLDDFFSDDEIYDSDQILDSISDNSSSYFLKGSFSLKSGYGFAHDSASENEVGHGGINDAKVEMDLEFGTKFFKSWDFFISGTTSYNFAFKLKNSNDYPEKFLEENEKELGLEKIFVRGALSKKLDIKIGRQIVIWGKSDNIRVTDVLNPMDLREPGMTDIEDLRLPVFMTRLDYYFANFSLSGILIHEHRSHQTPVFGSRYFYLPKALPGDTTASNKIENTEFAISLSAVFKGFDVALYLADIYDNQAFLNSENQMLHERIFMTGAALNIASGNFLYKTEAAFFDNIRLSAFRQNNILVDNFNDYSRLDFLAGVEYAGFKDTNVSFEMADKWLVNYDDAAKSNRREHTIQYAVRVARTFLHEVLQLSVIGSLYGKTGNDGGFIRTQASYDFSDELNFTFGTVFYTSGSQQLKGIGENDTIFLRTTYSF